MKFNKRLTMVPLLVGIGASTGSLSPTNLPFNESDIQKNLVNLDSNDPASIFGVENILYDREITRIRFKTFYQAWKSQTFFESNINKILNNVNFKKIVSLGEPAIDLIIDEIKERPSSLVWALNKILNTRISSQGLTIQEACKRWVDFWELSKRNNVSKL